MDRAVWTSAVIGFVTPIMLFQPNQTAGAWFSAWTQPGKTAVTEQRARNSSGPRSYEYDDAAPYRWSGSDGVRPAGSDRRARERPKSSVQVRVVRARRDARPGDRTVRTSVAAAKMIDPKLQLARTIDPSKQPDWYLTDPTIKKGDVLFLNNRVVVFKGVRVGNLKDYVPVSRTRLLTQRERRWIEKLAARSLPQPAPTTTVASAAAAIDAN